MFFIMLATSCWTMSSMATILVFLYTGKLAPARPTPWLVKIMDSCSSRLINSLPESTEWKMPNVLSPVHILNSTMNKSWTYSNPKNKKNFTSGKTLKKVSLSKTSLKKLPSIATNSWMFCTLAWKTDTSAKLKWTENLQDLILSSPFLSPARWKKTAKKFLKLQSSTLSILLDLKDKKWLRPQVTDSKKPRTSTNPWQLWGWSSMLWQARSLEATFLTETQSWLVCWETLWEETQKQS